MKNEFAHITTRVGARGSEVGSNGNALLEQALKYHRLGWCVIPIGSKKKPPKGFKWRKYQKTRSTKAELKECFGSGKYKSLAVVCGAVSGGLTVLDLDSKQRCEWWHRQHSRLADSLPTVRTRKGLHVYFRSEPFRKQNGDDVDLLCEGAYVILSPSLYDDGSGSYEWIRPLPENGELPLLHPFEWGLERFGIKDPDKEPRFTEEKEDKEEPEDIEDAGRRRSHKGRVGSLACLSEDEIKKEVEKAIEQTVPQKTRRRNCTIFTFCQWLKAIPELRDLPAGELKSIVRRWHEKAYSVIRTKPFSRTWMDFVHAWGRVKWPKGDVMLEQVVRKALANTAVLPAAEEYDTEEARLLLKVCFELQRAVGNRPFFLASRTAGGIIGESHTTAYKLLEMFVADGKLKLVERHTRTRAPRYQYIAN